MLGRAEHTSISAAVTWSLECSAAPSDCPAGTPVGCTTQSEPAERGCCEQQLVAGSEAGDKRTAESGAQRDRCHMDCGVGGQHTCELGGRRAVLEQSGGQR